MKNLIIYLIVVFTFNLNAQTQETPTRLMTNSEMKDMVKLALSDANVLSKKLELESLGYQYVQENSIGGIRETDGASFINLGFNKDIPSLTTHILYAKRGSEIYVTFFEANIRSVDGQLENVIAYDVVNSGQRGIDRFTATDGFLSCFATGCTAAMVGCALSNCGWLHCSAAWCAGAAVGCFIGGWF